MDVGRGADGGGRHPGGSRPARHRKRELMSKKIGQLLIEQGLLTKAQLQTALRTQEFFGGHLGSIFIELGFLREQALGEALSQATGVLYSPPQYLEGIPSEVHQLIPLQLTPS